MKSPDSIEVNLLFKVRLGDERAFDTLYHRHSTFIYRRLLMMVKDKDLAEELTQEIFIKLWDKREQIQATDSFKYFLLRMSKNLVIDFYRKVSRNRELLSKVIAASTELNTDTQDTVLYNETNKLFVGALDRLPPQQRQVFSMCKLDGLSYKEVSAILGISTSTISNHIVKATKTLKQVFEEEHGIIFFITILLL